MTDNPRGSTNAEASKDKLTYSGSLWDGFDAAFTRLTKARQDLKLMRNFFVERGKIEDQYAKALSAVSKQPPSQIEGSLGECWKSMTSAGVSLSGQHLQCGIMCEKVADTLEKMIVELKNAKEKGKTRHTRLHNIRAVQKRSHKKMQEQYTESISKAEKAIQDVGAGKEANAPAKSITKLEKAAASAINGLDKAHADYKTSVASLKASEVEYDEAVRQILDEFEELDRRRQKLLLELHQRNTQTYDFLKNALDQMVTLLHSALDVVDSEEEIQTWIRGTITGNEPPAHVEYVYQPSEIIDKYRGKDGAEIAAEAQPAPAPAPEQSAATVDETEVVEYAEALYDFMSDEPDDLPLVVGDVLKLTTCPPDEDWWSGELVSTGRAGMFPQTYVKKIDAPVEKKVEEEPAESGGGAPKLLAATCLALYDYAGSATDELTFKAGETLIITGEVDGWYLGKNSTGDKVGIFPSNYVELQTEN